MPARGPAEIIARHQPAVLPRRVGRDDVAGFTVVGQPFASGDLLCLRVFPASTFGPGYASVWHRAPDGRWTVYTNGAPELSCPRFVGAAASRVVETPVEVRWTGSSDIAVAVPGEQMLWTLHLGVTPVTRLMNAMMAAMPERLFRSDTVLAAMSLMSTLMLAAGRLRLWGHVPNRQWYQAAPRAVWVVTQSAATLAGRSVGVPSPLAAQALLGSVPMPQRGLVMMGLFSFEAYDPRHHLPIPG